MLNYTVIRKLRKDRGLTLAELALAIGISESLLSRYETGHMRRPNLVIIRDLERAFGLVKGALLE